MTVPPSETELIAAVFARIAAQGWRRLRLQPGERRVFGGRAGLLLAFGRLADAAALATDNPSEDDDVHDRLLDVLMARIEFLQTHRPGVLALLEGVRFDPAAAALLAAASLGSMGKLLEAAGLGSTGARGGLRRKGLLAVWLWTVRAWRQDTSDDLATTMAALDRALRHAERLGKLLQVCAPAES